jgi:hypothetical protein
MQRPPCKPGLQRLAGAELRSRTIKNFKETLQQVKEIESRVEIFKSFLEDEIQRSDEKAGQVDNIDS